MNKHSTVRKQFFRYVSQNILGMIGVSAYILADTFFIAQAQGADGIAALKIIVEQWPTAQVILLSGHADMQLAVQAMSEGAFGYLMKPVDFDELLFKIEDAAMQSRLEGPESDMAR